MTSFRVRLFGVLAIGPLALAAFPGCSDEDLTPQTSEKVTRLSDFDDDGMYVSDDCMRPDGSDGCVILPGPTECTYLEVTTTTTVLLDSAGNIVREETTECTKCLAEDLTVISESCSGTVGPGVICEPVDPATAGGGTDPGGSAGADEALPPTDPTDPAGSQCWVCRSEDGSITYYECIDPTTYCTTDAECPSGSHCEFYPPPPCDPASGEPCATMPDGSGSGGDGSAGDALIAPAGQCVPDAPVNCASDADCPAGYYCELYGSGTDPYPGDGSSGGASPIWAGGQCVPYSPPPECTSDADCPGSFCVISCDEPASGDPIACRSYCQPVDPPPPCGCATYYDQTSCESDPRCDWFLATDVPCDPDPSGTCSTGYGYCGAAPPSP